ncbi:flagellar basal body-associated FliL family protein [Alloiococcus sp. CFN-8]|uniref:flagellar basal body-associated FliL family protein n=1 Tax=Alloiococcus sp. CFN-8 TaxID=3416081 RepID=UPI003CF6F7E5
MAEVNNVKNSRRNMIMLIIIFAVIFSGIGLFAGSYMASGKILPDFDERVDAVNVETYSVDEFLINLADSDSNRYLKVVIYLSYDSNNESLFKELQLERTKPILKDAALTVLRSKTSKELSSVEGTELIKKELVEKFNSKLENGQVIGVYFPELIIQ